MSVVGEMPASPPANRLARDLDRDRPGHRAQVADRRVERARSRGGRRSRRRPGSGRRAGTSGRVIEPTSAAIAPSPRPGKTNTLLAWPDLASPPVHLDGLERRAGGDEGPAVGPAQDVDGRRLAGRGRVGERQDDRPFGPRGQRADDRLVERAADPGRADQDGRPDPLDRLDEPAGTRSQKPYPA